MHSITTNNEAQTVAFAGYIAETLQNGDILCLQGPLGAGKSVIARSIIQSLLNNGELEVPSPTFTLAQTYEWHDTLIWHFDLYRLEDPEEIYEIGWEEALSNGLLLIEWPERLGPLKPQNAKTLSIAAHGDSRTMTYDGDMP